MLHSNFLTGYGIRYQDQRGPAIYKYAGDKGSFAIIQNCSGNIPEFKLIQLARDSC